MVQSTKFMFVVWVALAFGCQRSSPVATPTSDNHRPQAEAEAPAKKAKPRFHALPRPVVETPPADAKVFRVTAREFYDEKDDADATLAKYSGGWVEVTGEFYSLQVAPYNFSHDLILAATIRPPETPGKGINTDFVNCWMAPQQTPWKQVKRTDEVTIRGVVHKTFGSIHLAECTIVRGGSSTLDISVDELAEKFEASPKDVWKEYNDQQAVVTGAFVGFMAPPNSDTESPDEYVALDGKTGKRFYAFVGGNKYLFDGVSPGESVTVLGQFYNFGLDEESSFDELTLQSSENLTPFVP